VRHTLSTPQHDLVMKRSEDGGVSWGPLVTLIDAVSFWPHITANKPPDRGNAVWDPTPVFDRSTGRAFVFFNGPGRRELVLSQTTMGWSDDGGSTWAFKNVTAECQRPGVGAGTHAGNTPGNGHGVQLSSGRLVIPMYAGTPSGASICYSDDHGATWQAAPTTLGGAAATEIEVAELNPTPAEGAASTLYMTVRNAGPKALEGNRQFSLSHDQGLSWSPRQNVQVPDPNCKGGVVQWPGGNGLVLSTSASCVGRVNQTIFLSLGNGVPGSWLHHQFISPESGYSTLQMTKNGAKIADLFERGGCSLTLALVDPREMVADTKNLGYLTCASSHCGGAHPEPPATPPDPSRGFCVAQPPPPPPPPPPISPACQGELNAFCSNATANARCVGSTVKSYPDAQPFVGRYDTGCTAEPPQPWPHGVPEGPCAAGGGLAKSWRCYSHLALDPAGSWSNSAPHPNAYCSSDAGALAAIVAKCGHA
jgi:sialidase-1